MKKLYKKILAIVAMCFMVVSCAIAFTGCIDIDYIKLEEKLETRENNYKANSEDVVGIAGCYKRVKAEYGDPNEPWYEYVVALFFNDEDSAITYYNEILKDYAIPASKEEAYYNEFGDNIVYTRVYTIVLYGTKIGVATALE